MSIASKIHPLRHLPTAALLLSLLCACSFHEYEDNTEADPVIPTEKYINLSIVVSSGNESTTRADETNDTPKGGEDGDGREAGLARENEVTGITLMLYRDDAGINTENGTTAIDFIKYYPVKGPTKPEAPNTDNIEVSYTTDPQLITPTDILLDTEYHAIVVANMDLTNKVKKGDKVIDVRDKCTKIIYQGTSIGIDAHNFVMSSEADFVFKLENPENKIIDGKSALVYSIDGIRIERLAARVDFWMKGATYKATCETPGYEYEVVNDNGQTTDDKFVLTAITPFNLYNDDEYLIKRITGKNYDYADLKAPVIYLGKERVTTDIDHLNYVLSPYTDSKTANTVPDYMEDYTLDNLLNHPENYKGKPILLSDFQTETEAKFTYPDGGGYEWDNIILCYPKENTLWKTTPLYYYATGLCIEGNYYKKGDETPIPLTYYGFIRHQGELGSGGVYNIMTKDKLADYMEYKEEENTIFPMNFGVVRNNIYRISIEEITQKGEIKWQIKVKKWDKFTHSTIYM